MRGHLGNGGLTELLRSLAAEQATGTLTRRARNGQAWVSLRDGAVEFAVSPGQPARLGARLVEAGYLQESELPRLQAEPGSDTLDLADALVRQELVAPDVVRAFLQEHLFDAVLHLTLLEDRARATTGEDEGWTLHPQLVDAPSFLPGTPVGDVLEGVARRRQEWDRITRLLESLDHVPIVVASPGASLEPDEAALMAAIDGERSLRRLAEHLGLGELDTARLVYGLVLLGVVEMRPPPTGSEDIDVGLALEEALSQDFSADFSGGFSAYDPAGPPAHDPADARARHPADASTHGLADPAADGPEPAAHGPGEPAAHAPGEPARMGSDPMDLDWSFVEDLPRGADEDLDEIEPLVWSAVLDDDVPTPPSTQTSSRGPADASTPPPERADSPLSEWEEPAEPPLSSEPGAPAVPPDSRASSLPPDPPVSALPEESTVSAAPPEPAVPAAPAEPAIPPPQDAQQLAEAAATAKAELRGLLEEQDREEPPGAPSGDAPMVTQSEGPIQRDRNEIYELLRELTWLSEDPDLPRPQAASSSAQEQTADARSEPSPDDQPPTAQPPPKTPREPPKAPREPPKAPRDPPRKRRGRLFGSW